MHKRVDTWFLGVSATLLIAGTFIFISASLGLLARNEALFSGIIFMHLVSIFLGLLVFFILLKLDYTLLRRYSLYLFLASVILTALVFVPHIGFEHSGAARWLIIGPFSIQPSEFLKIAFILYFATWLAATRKKIFYFAYGLLPLCIMLALTGGLLLAQPDTGTFLVIFGTAIAMYFTNGARLRDIAVLMAIAVAGIAALALFRPYVLERFAVFLNPALDPQGAGYQIQQSLIAIGSGELFGRGFGQSIQKFNFLPEPISDSIFAVFTEEFGFIGAFFLVALFLFFAMRGILIARHAPDQFARLTVIGLVILIIGQAFLNIGSMLGIVPLTGLPLPFVSHGGTAMIATLGAIGIILNISRYAKR